jgi:rSAM/selenodomain-associated transferase 2/rSAM/selenodomain-associated transferase 1
MISVSALHGRPDSEKSGERIIVFTRYPEPGETKTRLIPLLGPDGAARLHRRLAERVLDSARFIAKHREVSVEVRYEGGSREAMEQWLNGDCFLREQPGGDLGYRMWQTFQEAFESGHGRVVMVGTDIPGLSSAILENALDRLHDADVVLGPARDGGYYLMGLRKPSRELFTEMPWGTETVLETTVRAASRLGLSVAFVQPLQDIDRPEDLGHCPAELFVSKKSLEQGQRSGRNVAVSVIIPTLNEAPHLAPTLASVKSVPEAEVLVVDGGSSDSTVDIAGCHGVKVIHGPTGKAAQMNLGAARSRGDILLLLHADTLLPEGWMTHVMAELDKPGVVAGAFRLRIQGSLRGLRMVERLANFRSTRLQMPYGDQAIFLKADLFHRLGGFPDLPIMEDFELVRCLKQMGRISTIGVPVVTSARRWVERGVLRTTLINQLIILLYFLGVSPALLERLYGRGKGKERGRDDLTRRRDR